ncbi:unnamed protein product [Cuscuta epithymum]|uniref:Uncharacterized protein n=1 Tax=Cuscuta epithymum TaxID=186058 RepID=A0AAV0F489_9ASTE|nr:unnamed protein product [Cuscuta epithymum]CAH9130272.1 unnamed protein product [Cuscuta epithymum]
MIPLKWRNMMSSRRGKKLNICFLNQAIICGNIKKAYPGRDGNPEKFAVKGLPLALPRGMLWYAWAQRCWENFSYKYVSGRE